MELVIRNLIIRVQIERLARKEDPNHAERLYRQAEAERYFNKVREEALQKVLFLGLKPWR
ncbi:MAG: hypothetical protein HPY71_08900 [Firmicutes bacterium]|nr:hypothetical protein [Bacillota bacterium]